MPKRGFCQLVGKRYNRGTDKVEQGAVRSEPEGWRITEVDFSAKSHRQVDFLRISPCVIDQAERKVRIAGAGERSLLSTFRMSTLFVFSSDRLEQQAAAQRKISATSKF